MPVKIVDASAIAALLFGEPEAEAVAASIAGASLIAPPLLDFELASVCVKKCKRYPDQRVAFLSALKLLSEMDIHEAGVHRDDVVDLALASGLTAYDASYLWLSRYLGADLVTLDVALGNAVAQTRRRYGSPSG